MNNKTEILCSVHSCKFHKENHCCAEKISVSCDNCILPNTSHETECKSFQCNCSK
ncbi:MAG: DUF1540 domain-containing protein [Erysipelotrichaceae bacterium]|uniref:DUF1540 domain-containing protein n=1 Tax=Copranaerobaculum intestinale TaxID=2692629 RepID=A0A6N8U6W4_9FIRM|nr:DUF1540 domain-containing protein [Copranaerobaculum intestinale]MBS6373627.1 DUF1540 domain-containing protein [Erysipelotrichaceae bacterium]MXQ73926.1 DUF1540 domain-containing protein [Copranaerobaculum intestinale]